MKILITGSKGFVGKNIELHLKRKNFHILTFNRYDNKKKLYNNLNKSDLIIHCAGENRASNPSMFYKNNTNLTNEICKYLIKNKKKTKIIFTSTTKINYKSIYSKTKKQCEKILINYKNLLKADVSILRFPNLFGKWSKPNYNSVIATFCHNVSRDTNIKVFDKSEKLSLLYIDDAIDQIYSLIKKKNKYVYPKIKQVRTTSVSLIAKKIINFQKGLNNNYVEDLSNKLDKNLYSTFISFLPRNKIFTDLKKNNDKRGNFVEYIKSNKLGQISVFTINKNQQRGGHYHNSKVEKFLIIKGNAKLIFEDVKSQNYFSRKVSEKKLQLFHSIPGWIHTIKNVGNNKIVGIVWANEIFDKNKADTYYN